METPCQQHPAYFAQDGEDPAWHLDPSTHWAIDQCRHHCLASIEDCARAALSAGTLPGADPDTHPRVASGVVQAGIACRGDIATYQALLELAYPDGDQPTALTVACPTCARPFITGDDADTDEHVHRASLNSPFCRGCYSGARRRGVLQPLRTVVPSHCTHCNEPMTTKRGVIPAGTVRHESGGRCATCVRNAQRSEGAAAA